MDAQRRLLCLQCGGEFAQAPNLSACPGCGDSEGIPADLSDTVTITLTTHELRILTIWATNWAHQCGRPNVATTITDRLAHFTEAPLSMAQEVADLSTLPNVGDVQTRGIPGLPDTLDDEGR